jgi:hypothetical protein
MPFIKEIKESNLINKQINKLITTIAIFSILAFTENPY